MTQDQTTGEISVSDDAHTELGRAADAWEKYLKVNKGQANPAIAAQMVQAFYFLNDAQGAADSTADRCGGPAQLGHLRTARFLPVLRRRHLGRRSGGRARPRRRRRSHSGSQLKQQLTAIRKQAVKAKKQLAKAQKNAPSPNEPGGKPIQNPFGGAPPPAAP